MTFDGAARGEAPARLGALRDIGSSVFGPFIDLARRRPRQGSDVDLRLRRLEAESAIRDAFSRYHYFYDAGRAEDIGRLFTEDAVLVNPRGTYVGRDSITRNYGFLVDRPGPVFHHATNVVVRLDEEHDDVAYLTAFLWCVHTTQAAENGTAQIGGAGGTYSIAWRREGGDWLMASSRLTLNYQVGLRPPAPGRGGNPPTPDRAETSTSWLTEDPEYSWPRAWN